MYCLILLWLQNLFLALPFRVRKFLVKGVLRLPLWLSRLIMNISTTPAGDEPKWIHKIERPTWKGVWIVPDLNTLEQAEQEALSNDVVVFYAHGGGYCKGSATMYMPTFMLIINSLRTDHNIRASILSLEYSLSPENVWPKARDEAMEAYQYLTDTIGIPSSKIVMAGDSAGGNLVTIMLLTIKYQMHRLQPAGAALFSPWVDLTVNQTRLAVSYIEYYIPNFKGLSEMSRLSVLRNPLISPVFGDFSNTCPMFLAYGENELLRASIENFMLNLETDGISVTPLMGEKGLHVSMIFSYIATSKETFEKEFKKITDWIASIMAGSSGAAKSEYVADVIDMGKVM